MPKAEPCRGKGGVHGGGLAKVVPRALVPADAEVVAGHTKPRDCSVWILLHQPALTLPASRSAYAELSCLLCPRQADTLVPGAQVSMHV